MEIEDVLTKEGKEYYDYYLHLNIEYRLKNTFEDFLADLKECENCGNYVLEEDLCDAENALICLDCKNDGYFE